MSKTLDDVVREANERRAVLSPYATPVLSPGSSEARFCVFIEQYALEDYLDGGDPSPFPNGDMCFVVAARVESEDEAESSAIGLWHQLHTEQLDLRRVVDVHSI